MFENICESILREMDKLDEKYSNGAQMSSQDLKDIDVMAHTLKGIATYEAMKGDYDYRGRRATSRYSRDYESRDDGYRRY